MRNIKFILLSIIITNLSACAVVPIQEFTDNEQNIARTLILDGEEIKENKPGDFIYWRCSDYINGGSTLVEVGRVSSDFVKKQMPDDSKDKDVDIEILGFVLYDGTNTGDFAFYKRRGINQRWDWGSEGSSYSFIIKPDGTGLFYDFSTAKNGKKSKADDIYKCSR